MARPKQQWPGITGILERMACCAIPSESVSDLIAEDDDDDIIDLQAQTRQSFARLQTRPQHTGPDGLHPPTLSPSRRELERFTPQESNDMSLAAAAKSCCSPSYADSTATTASIMSYDYDIQDLDEIKSNATTQVISHRLKQARRNSKKGSALLSTALASAEHELRRQRSEQSHHDDYRRITPR